MILFLQLSGRQRQAIQKPEEKNMSWKRHTQKSSRKHLKQIKQNNPNPYIRQHRILLRLQQLLKMNDPAPV